MPDMGSQGLVVHVSVVFLVATALWTALFGFVVGQVARFLVIDVSNQNVQLEGFVSEELGLPQPTLTKGKKVPRTVYTSKTYDIGGPVTSASVLARLQEEKRDWIYVGETHSEECDAGAESAIDEEEFHEPAGQHLLLDIENLDGSFLNSKKRLAQAMLDLVNMSGLTMLSYHCHEMEPAGVSCAGVLLESHVSFHTWPAEGVITLDLFTCGPNSLVPLVQTVKDLFFVPRVPTHSDESVEPPHMLWSFKRRGFRSQTVDAYDASACDIYNTMLGVMEYEMKDLVASVETEYQEIEVYDVIHPRFRTVEQYKQSLSNDGSYESRHPEFFQPDRILYLDGVLQSSKYGEASYHEALVHPALFAHDNPKSVVIIGGGEGATLREVLKHDTVEKVFMVEADAGMVTFAKQYLKGWNDCSDIAGSTESCFDDPRAELVLQDAVKWFLEETKEGMFDVVIMDALDPEGNVEFSDYLFKNPTFAEAVFQSLTRNGIFVAQTGEASIYSEPGMHNTRRKDKAGFFDGVEEAGYEAMRTYEESHSGFMNVWSFLVSFKSITTKSNWLSNEAEVNLGIHQRTRRTVSGKPILSHFDGATMTGYHFPSRPEQDLFCRTYPDASGCNRGFHGIDPQNLEIRVNDFEVKQSKIVNAGRGVFTKVDIPKGAFIAPKETTKGMYLPPKTYAMIYNLLNHTVGQQWSFLDPYIYGHGYAGYSQGLEDRTIDPGLLTFMNHGCNGTYNVSPPRSFTEMNANPEKFPEDDPFDWEDDIFNPYIDRNYHVLVHEVDIANTDIAAGTEILDNFVNYAASEEMWRRSVTDLRAMCAGNLGTVSRYEKDN